MSDAEFLAALDERIAQLEALVKRSLCKCVVGPYWLATNDCPIHSSWPVPVDVQQVLRDQGREVREGVKP